MNSRRLICFVTLLAGVAILTTSKLLSRKLVNNYKKAPHYIVIGSETSGVQRLAAESNSSNHTDCRNRTIDEFPGDFLTLEQKRDGGVIIHILITAYLFCAVAIVCDEYFVQSLNRISKGLHKFFPKTLSFLPLLKAYKNVRSKAERGCCWCYIHGGWQ